MMYHHQYPAAPPAGGGGGGATVGYGSVNGVVWNNMSMTAAGGTTASMGTVAPMAAAQTTQAPTPPSPTPTMKKGPKKSSESRAQLRKVKNREFAKRSRDRKKALQETLEQEMRVLQEENNRLKKLIRNKIPDKAASIIGECCYSLHSLPSHIDQLQQQYSHSHKDDLDRSDFELIESLAATRQSFCITNPRLPDNPIVYASEAFLDLTGYSREKVIGRNCRFLQGPATDSKAVAAIREAVKSGTDATTCLLNFKADGTPFWNQFFLAALRDKHRNILNYVGVQCPVDPPDTKPKPLPKELALAAANHPQQQEQNTPSPSNLDTMQPLQPTLATPLPHAVANRIASTSSQNTPVETTGITVAAAIPTAPAAALNTTPSSLTIENQNSSTLLQKPQEQQDVEGGETASLDGLDDFDFDELDFSILAEALEGKFKEGDNDEVHDDSIMCLDDEDISSQDDENSNNDNSNNNSNNNKSSGQDSSDAQDAKMAPSKITQNTIVNNTARPLLPRNISSSGDDASNEPLSIVTKTVRSELIDALLLSHGDVAHPRFISALDVLSTIYSSSCNSSSGSNGNYSISTSDQLHASWRSISRPSYNGCLGRDTNGDFVYELGKMSFNMFRPGNLRCSIQRTLNDIQPVCKMDGAPAAAPWSLRRELAVLQQNGNEEEDGENGYGENNEGDGSEKIQKEFKMRPNTMLKSYNIAVALTIEPGQFNASPKDQIPSPPCRLRALKVIQGYFLPDPDTPNRLTVWFTGGELSPAPPTNPDDNDSNNEKNKKLPSSSSPNKFGGIKEWKNLFGGTHKRTWGESFSVMGARLFLGAEVTDGMDENGTMRYTLRRPVGGHGKAYVDVIYMDDDLLITKGNKGTIHVMVKNSSTLLSKHKDAKSATTTTANIPNVTPSQKTATNNDNAIVVDDNNDDDDDAVVVTEDDESNGPIPPDFESPHVANATMMVPDAENQPCSSNSGRKRKAPDSSSDLNMLEAESNENLNKKKTRRDSVPTAEERRFDYAMDNMRFSTLSSDLDPSSSHSTAAAAAAVTTQELPPLPVVSSSCDSHKVDDGVSNILRSVEAFFGVDMF